jgi:hypothetical protein
MRRLNDKAAAAGKRVVQNAYTEIFIATPERDD